MRFGPPCEQQQVIELGSAISKGPAPLLHKTALDGTKTCLDGSPYGDGTRCAAPGGLVVPVADAPAPVRTLKPYAWKYYIQSRALTT